MPLFYLTKGLEHGPPTEDCVDAVIHEVLLNNMAIGIISATAAWAFWIAGIAAGATCGKSKDDKDGKA